MIKKFYILTSTIMLFAISSCISVSDLVGDDSETVDSPTTDEIGQLLSDIQAEDNDFSMESNTEENLTLSDEKLDPTPTQEYDSVLLDNENSTKEVEQELPKTEIINDTETKNFQEFESTVSKLSINDKIQYRVATINFYSGSSNVDMVGLRKIKKIAKIAKERSAKIKIVGHASKRTRDMPLAKHKLVNFNISDRRAQSVADVFIKKHKFPSTNLITEAVSDTKPLFKENMPAGTRANQRTEIFLIY